VALYRVRHILIAVPSAGAERMRRLVERSVDARVDVKLLPPLKDLVSGAVQVNQVRDVEISDLLGREPVTLDLSSVEPRLAGKVVVVTGAGGSIGSELARQIMRFRPMRLILIERAESPLHYTYIELSASKDVHVVPVLASVTNAERLQHIFDVYRPDYVFHAAAYKHVPMLEWNVVEGVWNNVFGTMRVAQCAAAAGVSNFVLISTDKAVHPASVLGATKLIAERVVLDLPSLRACGTDFRVVRFGNVLGSEGSVVPLFKRQLSEGGPLTVTHPDAHRYLMTIPEAVQLVLQASVHPDAAGRIAVLEMGSQVRILDLAEQLIRLSGLVPHEDVDILFTGMRPGEKLHEELLARGETAIATEVEAIRLVERDGSVPAPTELARRLRNLRNVTARRDEQAIIRALSLLAPEYTPWQPHDVMPHRNGNGNGNGKAHSNGNGHHANGNGNGKKPVARRNGRATNRVPPTLTASAAPQQDDV
jgi:FlaA1/EpsC-like NDP-sugar epimerase